MVGIQYQFGKEQSIKLLKSIIKAINDDKLILMDIELQTKKTTTVKFHCYECGHDVEQTFLRREDVSKVCDECYHRKDDTKRMNPYLIKRTNKGASECS